jgi:SlyX protein
MNSCSQETIAQLQSQLSFQEHELEKMHQALYEQQRRMDSLELQLKRLTEQYKSLTEEQYDSSKDNEKPPHY